LFFNISKFEWRENVLEGVFKLSKGFNQEQMDQIHEKALHLCETVGLYVHHEGILKLLSNYNGVKIEKGNVRFSSDLVQKALNEAEYILPEYAKKNWVMSAGAHQTTMYDIETGKLRKTTLNDLIDLIKLGDALDTVGSAPVVPLDQPYHLKEILMHKIPYEYSKYRSNDLFEHAPMPTYECATYVYEMAKAAEKWFTFGVWIISPRSFDTNELDVVYKLLDRGIPMWISSMPIAGISSPITMQATILQSVFEHLAGLTMLNLINTKSFNYISPNDAFEADQFDMKYTTFVYGTPEYTRATVYEIELCNYYGIPKVSKSLLTTSKEPDAQAAFEIGIHTLFSALAGARAFRCGGLLSNDEIYSAGQLVIDHEIINYTKSLVREQEFSEEKFMIDEIKDVGPGQSFIGRLSTLENFKKEYWEPDLFIRTNLGQWQKMGSKPIRQYAIELAKKKIKEHTYIIDDDVRKELDRIYKSAKNDEKLKDSYKF
jgi:trimethylamine--corrinoid protein Co-methyltransferase